MSKESETIKEKVERLKYLRHKAWQNARQQRARLKLGLYKTQRVRAEFWEQVARDYTCEIKALQKGNY